MAPLLQQPERWGKRERSDIVEKKGDRFFCFFLHFCLPTVLFHRCVCVHSAFYGTETRAPIASESGLFLSSFGFCIFHAFKSSGWRVARLRGARGCPRAGVKTSFFFPFLSPPRPFPALPFPPPVLSLLPSLLLLSGLGPAQVIRHQVRQMQHRLQQE